MKFILKKNTYFSFFNWKFFPFFSAIPNFINNLRYVLDKMEANPSTQFSADDKDTFINSAGLIYDGVKEIRQAVLFNRVSY